MTTEYSPVSATYYAITRKNVHVELEWIGEGYNGDYQPTDPEDAPLLRFTVSKIHTVNDNTYHEPVDDASYCTCITTNADIYKLDFATRTIMDAVFDKVVKGESVKRICEELSSLS